MKNKKKAFTLVELLAVIVILGIIIGLAIPKMMSILNDKKETLYQDTKKELERLASSYVTHHPNLLRQDNFSISIDSLCNDNYIECPVIDPRDNSEMNGRINISKVNNNYTYTYLNGNKNINLSLNLDGGILSENIQNMYYEGELVLLSTPAKTGYQFSHWSVESGNSVISRNNLYVGSTATTIKANWSIVIELTVNLDGGLITTNPAGNHFQSENISLTTPTKTGYQFSHWSVERGNSTISGNNLQMGSTATTIKANWFVGINLTVNLDGGLITTNPAGNHCQGENISLTTPTKTGYQFSHWSLENGNSTISGNNLIIGSQSSIIKANYTPISYTIAYSCGDGFGNISNSSHTYDIPKSLNKSECYKAVEGTSGTGMVYYIKGWTTTQGGNLMFNKEEEISNLTTIQNDIVILYPIYDDLFSYDGDYEVSTPSQTEWKIKLLTSGTFISKEDPYVSVFLVGGGAGGNGRQGGGGGYTSTHYTFLPTTSQNIVIGAGGQNSLNGESSSAFNFIAEGGKSSGDGGSGGAAICVMLPGSNGQPSNVIYNGGDPRYKIGGMGQNRNTCEFGEGSYGGNCNEGVTLYSGGGGGGSAWAVKTGSPGGAGGGGNGGDANETTVTNCVTLANGLDGVDNTGGGGGGAGYCGDVSGNGGAGGSGIVIIKNSNLIEVGDSIKYKFSYSGMYNIINKNTDNWKLQFLTSGKLISSKSIEITAFLVGGGAGGNGRQGGGGGYTTTSPTSLLPNMEYNIVVGLGGQKQSNGGDTSAFNITAEGGKNNGNGGSGGATNSMLLPGSNGATSNIAYNGGDARYTVGGIGQQSNTCEFGEGTYGGSCNEGVTLYSGGGGGGSSWAVNAGSPGGAGGGGNGGNGNACTPLINGQNGIENLGGGGGGGGLCVYNSSDYYNGVEGIGGSGIVIIRKR